MAEPTLQTIVAAGLCTGCGACGAALTKGRVAMRLDAAGYLRPEATGALSADEEKTVRQVCPGIALRHAPEVQLHYHPIWGPVRRVAAGHTVDHDLRHLASSGGVLSALLIHLLVTRQVDFVVHVRVASDDPLRNDAVISTTPAEVAAGAGSRYAPAAPLTILPSAIERGGRFAFVGKPCDAAALRKMMARDPVLAERVAVVLSFMCAGTPSLRGSHEVLQRFGMTASDLVSFRYRGAGWPGLARAEDRQGRVGTMDYNTAWGSILNRHLQPRCKLCADGTGEFADLVCADAWYGKDGYPEFTEREGRSLVLVRTPLGERLLDGAKDVVTTEPFDLTTLGAIQPYQFKRKAAMLARLIARRVLLRRVPSFSGMGLAHCARHLSLKVLVREFLGTLKRTAQGRI